MWSRGYGRLRNDRLTKARSTVGAGSARKLRISFNGRWQLLTVRYRALNNSMASEEDDFRLALEVQLQIDEERSLQAETDKQEGTDKSTKEAAETSVVPYSLWRNLSVVDPFWELNDPTPDVHLLFVEFNEAFFWGKLACVEVRWSRHMTSCAGLCCYEGRFGLCSIRLSLRLLQLRPRKDLVETLLHEMIHAFLFVTHNNKDHSAHGPEFHRHMERINRASGAKITVYHQFHDEVDSYRVHVWRCDGRCQHKPPYHGYIKRAMNRAPSPKDFWWPRHERECGGTYHKIQGPEPSKGKRKDASLLDNKAAKKPKVAEGVDIRTMLVPQNVAKASTIYEPASHNQEGPKVRVTNVSNRMLNIPGTMTRLPSNVRTLSQPAGKPQMPLVASFTGTGHTLGGDSSKSKLLESGKGLSSARDTSASSCVLGTAGIQKENLLLAPDGTAASVPGHSANKDWTGTGAKPKSQKPSHSVQQTLTDLMGQRKPPAKRISRENSAAKMKFIKELLSSDSESDDDCTIIPDEATLGTKEEYSRASSLSEPSLSYRPSSSHTSVNASAPRLVQCPVCGCFIEDQYINSHLDVCLVPDD